jgi:hypothetical protein
MENQKWMVVTSGHNDYVKIVTEIDNFTIAYYDTDKKNVGLIQKIALEISDEQNRILKILKKSVK